MNKLSIQEPCHQNFAAMQATSQGAFCGSCQKEVIDFTKMTDQEVLSHLSNYKNNLPCARIKQSQLTRLNLHVDPKILTSNISLWKKYLAAILICFGSMLISCDTPKTGKALANSLPKSNVVSSINKNSFSLNSYLAKDTFYIPPKIMEEAQLVGIMAYPVPPETLDPVVQGGFIAQPQEPIINPADSIKLDAVKKMPLPKPTPLDSLKQKTDSLNALGST